jgi:hypothetical protein
MSQVSAIAAAAPILSGWCATSPQVVGAYYDLITEGDGIAVAG